MVILVVVGHGTYYNIITKFGGIYYADLMLESNITQPIFYRIVNLLTSYIYTFHMPIFISLSGSLYALSKYKSYKLIICQKVKRLLIPFFVIWLGWNVPIKYLTGYYTRVPISKILLQMFFPANVYLWYLESLFFVFLIFGGINKLQRNYQSILIFLLWVVGIILYKKLGQYHPLGDPLYYLGWFYLGYRIEDIITVLKKIKLWSTVPMVALLLFQIVMFFANRYLLDIKIIDVGCKYIVFPLAMLLVLNYFIRVVNPTNQWIVKVSGYGMGIYLYAEPLNYLVLYIFYTHCGIEYFGTNLGAMVICFSRIIVTPIIAVCITWLLKRMNVKYLY